MLKGNCPMCNQAMQWNEPEGINSLHQVYVVRCPSTSCGVRVAVQNDSIVPVVKTEKVPTEVLYHVYRIETSGRHLLCESDTPLPYHRAKQSVEAGIDLCKQKDFGHLVTYYMKPVLDGLA